MNRQSSGDLVLIDYFLNELRFWPLRINFFRLEVAKMLILVTRISKLLVNWGGGRRGGEEGRVPGTMLCNLHTVLLGEYAM